MDTSYEFEPELRTGVRQTTWTSEARDTRTLFVGLLLATLLIGGFFAARDLSDLHALRRQGREVSAQVTGKRETHGKSVSYNLEYRFYSGGEWINDHDDVPQYLYESTPIGDTLGVTYLPSDPTVHRIGSVDDRRVARRTRGWLFGIGGIAAFFLLGIWGIEYDYQRQMRLAISGIPTAGSIISCEPVMSGNQVKWYQVKYTFADLRSNTRTAGWSAPEALGKRLQNGQNVTVLCDADNPNHFVLYTALTAVRVEGASILAPDAS